MATAAQVLANQANAQHSTGPCTAEGKARSARNNLQHGLTLGVLTIEDHERQAHARLAEELRQQIQPGSNLEEEAFRQILDGAWRLEKIHALIGLLYADHNGDPFSHPEAVARLHALTRYRAAAEMVLYRGVKEVRDLQTLRLCRRAHLTSGEREHIPPSVNPGPRIMVDEKPMHMEDRNNFYTCYGFEAFADRFSEEGLNKLHAFADGIRRSYQDDGAGDEICEDEAQAANTDTCPKC